MNITLRKTTLSEKLLLLVIAALCVCNLWQSRELAKAYDKEIQGQRSTNQTEKP